MSSNRRAGREHSRSHVLHSAGKPIRPHGPGRSDSKQCPVPDPSTRELKGQSEIRMYPDPTRQTLIPIREARLIR